MSNKRLAAAKAGFAGGAVDGSRGGESRPASRNERKKMMDSQELRAFLDLLMCSDPWPVRDQLGQECWEDTLKSMADRMALDRGYTDWIDAYHRHEA